MLKRAFFTPSHPPRAETRVSPSFVLAAASVERRVLTSRGRAGENEIPFEHSAEE